MEESKSKIIKVLVVDDSAFMRKALTIMLESDPQIKVIGTARDGEESIEKVKNLNPDLVTMDIEMPRMDGLTALRTIMDEHPTPVIMVSSVTTSGATATLDALEMGAIDFIPKQLSYVSLDIIKIKEELLEKIKNIAVRKNILMSKYKLKAEFQGIKNRISPAKISVSDITGKSKDARKQKSHLVRIVAVGSSTGGPPALINIIPRLPRNFPVSIVVAQHMPATFTKSLAERLDRKSQLTVKEAENGEFVEPGLVYIAPGGQHIAIDRHGAKAKVKVTSEPAGLIYKPCIDILMNSVAEIYGKTGMGVILTGMGHDGLDGMRKLKEKGGIIIAQNEATCTVYGMPRAVIEAGLADRISPIGNISQEIANYF